MARPSADGLAKRQGINLQTPDLREEAAGTIRSRGRIETMTPKAAHDLIGDDRTP